MEGGISKSRLEHRPSSRNSNNSDNSAMSENCLLPPLTRNDLSKSSSEEPSRHHLRESILMKTNFSGEISGSDSINIYNNTDSPTLSRGSWARSSDGKRPQGVEDFVTIAFDDSSSTERRGSDSSSLAGRQRPRSLSPLDVANLWQDAHGKLLQTIAATIAAATGSSVSSSEGAPSEKRASGSHNSTLLSQVESFSGSSQNSVFAESNPTTTTVGDDDINEPRSQSQNGSLGSVSSGRQREAMCSLPDILEAVEHENTLEMLSGSEISYSNNMSKNGHLSPQALAAAKHLPSKVEKSFGKNDFPQSPYPEDSTLTASKLASEKPKSYLQHTFLRHRSAQLNDSNVEVSGQLEEDSLQDSNLFHDKQRPDDVSSSPEWIKSGASKDSDNGNGNDGPSPFTDQELVLVMANSLKSYMGYSTPTTSTASREREGLALTIDDLRISPDDKQGTLSSTNAVIDGNFNSGNIPRTRSSSSLFHDDSENSSPISTASKMQRQKAAEKVDVDLSPNALKHMNDDFPLYLKETMEIHGIPKSEALNILREAYAYHTLKIAPGANQSSNRLSPSTAQSGLFQSGSGASFRRNTLHTKPGLGSSKEKSPKNSIYPGDSSWMSSHPSEYISMGHRDPERYHTDENVAPYKKEGDIILFDSIALHKSKLVGKNLIGAQAHIQAGKSKAKKLSVLGVSVDKEDSASSPFKSGKTFELSASNKDGAIPEDYVRAKYRPPLYEKIDDQEVTDSLSRNMNQYSMRSSRDMDSKQRQIMELAAEDNTHRHQRKIKNLDLSDESEIEFLRKEIIKHNRKRSQPVSDFFNLNSTASLDSNLSRKHNSSVSQPNLKRNSQACLSLGRDAKAAAWESDSWRNNARVTFDIPHSYRSSMRSTKSSSHRHDNSSAQGRTKDLDLSSTTYQELEASEGRVVDYFSNGPALNSQSGRLLYEDAQQYQFRQMKHHSQPELGIHGRPNQRSPLRPIHHNFRKDGPRQQ